MKKSRTIIIGDVHGCFDELMLLLNKVKHQEHQDELIFVGDLINKGPYSFQTLQWVKEKNIKVVIGNHELAFVKAIKKNHDLHSHFKDLRLSMSNQLDDWVAWIESWPAFIETQDYLVVHAGVIPNQDHRKTPVEILANIRTFRPSSKDFQDKDQKPWFEQYNGKKLIVFGHFARLGLIKRDNSIGLDTGCVYGKQLSALILPQREIVQVQAFKKYCAIT